MLCILIPADEIRVGLKEEVYIFEPDLREVCTVLSHFCRVQLFVTLWTIAHQAPLSMGFSWQEYWNELPCPLPEDLSDPGIEPASLKPPASAGMLFATNATWQAPKSNVHTLIKNTLLLSGKESTCQCRRYRLNPWFGRIPHAMGQLSPCTTTAEPVL